MKKLKKSQITQNSLMAYSCACSCWCSNCGCDCSGSGELSGMDQSEFENGHNSNWDAGYGAHLDAGGK